MRRPVLVAMLLCAAPFAARAQVADSSPFRPLALPTPSAVRTGSGAPGRGYWQNRADYLLEARLDTAAEQLRGSGRIRYVNNSPDSLPFIWLQLDQDIFADRSINRRVPSPPLLFGGTPFDMMVKEPGGLAMDTLRTSRGLAGTQRYDTMLRLDLERALGPGDTVEITAAWHFRIPVNGVARMGRDGRLYEIAQWYPRLAVYDDVHGWNTLPYVGPGEFYLEYGDFRARITVPASFIVAATGELTNADTVLTGDQRQRLARARTQSEPVAIITAEEAGDQARTRPTHEGTLTWSFTARNVRDFAFAAAPNFRWEAVRAEAGGESPRLVQVFYRPGAANWTYAIRMAKHAIESFSSRWFPYAYPQASVIEGPIQGMEYPMIVFVPADTSAHGLSWTLMHELGHEWFPMMVGSDERRHPWMDEGFNSFIDLYTVSDWYRGRDDSHADSILNGPLTTYPLMAVPGREQPMSTNPMESHDLYWTAYQKPALMMRLLREEVVGPDVFDRAMTEYVRRWQGKHPQPADFFRTIENVSGRNLDWFWREWIYTTARLDQSVDSVIADGDTTRIVLHNRREMLMPAEVRISFDTGAAETRRLPIEMWNYGPRHAMLVATHERHVTAVEVDPRHALPDTDRGNNSWSAAATAHHDVAAPATVTAAAAAGAAAAGAPPAAPPPRDPNALVDTVHAPTAAPVAAAAVADATGITDPRAAMDIMRTDLINLAHAERAYFERSGRYTTEMASLGFLPTRGITVTVGYATEQGWRALARHAGTGARCATFGGNATPPSASAQPEVPVCR